MTEICPQTGLIRDYAAEAAKYDARCRAIALACDALRHAEIGRKCAQLEAEADEFQSAEQKARG